MAVFADMSRSLYLESGKPATAPACIGKVGVSLPIAIVAGARQRKVGKREIGYKVGDLPLKRETWSLCIYRVVDQL